MGAMPSFLSLWLVLSLVYSMAASENSMGLDIGSAKQCLPFVREAGFLSSEAMYGEGWAVWSISDAAARRPTGQGDSQALSWALLSSIGGFQDCLTGIQVANGWNVLGKAAVGSQIAFWSWRERGRWRKMRTISMSCSQGLDCWFILYIDSRRGAVEWNTVFDAVEGHLGQLQFGASVCSTQEQKCEVRDGKKDTEWIGLEKNGYVSVAGWFVGMVRVGDMRLEGVGEAESHFLCLLESYSGIALTCEVVTCRGWRCESLEWEWVERDEAFGCLRINVYAWLSDSLSVRRFERNKDGTMYETTCTIGMESLDDSGRFSWSRKVDDFWPWVPFRNTTASPTPTVGTATQPTASHTPSPSSLKAKSPSVVRAEESVGSTVAAYDELVEKLSIFVGGTFLLLCLVLIVAFVLIRWHVKRKRADVELQQF